MSLIDPARTYTQERLPRTCGDEPNPYAYWRRYKESAPHLRG